MKNNNKLMITNNDNKTTTSKKKIKLFNIKNKDKKNQEIKKKEKPIKKLKNETEINLDSKPKKKKSGKAGLIITCILCFFMLCGIIAMIAIIAFGTYIVLNAPTFDTEKLYNKEATIFLDKNGNEFARVGAEQRDLVYYEDLPEVLIDAIVATEDSRFFQHNGFDVVRFIKASFGQFLGQDGAGGASTLTMQVAKNAFSKDENGSIASSGKEGIIRKFNDIYISVFKIEKNYTKEEIIEFYVNAPFLGQNTYGVEQACQLYFGKSVSDITLTEAALLIGIFNAPSSYNPFYSVELATQRRATVLNLMVRHGYITEEQAADANAISVESLITDKRFTETNRYQQFINVVSEDIIAKFGLNPYETSMIIHTTMDPEQQDIMIALNDETNDENDPVNYTFQKSYMKTDFIDVGIAVVDVHDGSISAVDGGRDKNALLSNSNATLKDKQPGSTAKPFFAYGPYIEYNNGNPGTIFFDNQMTYSNGVSLKNSDGKYRGAMTMREALAASRNIPAVQAFMAVDKENIANFVHNCGFDYGTDLYESYAIGGGLEVSPLDMAAAYATLARGGYYIEPYSYTKIEFLETDEVYEHKYEKIEAMSPETAYMLNDILMTATEQGVGGNIKTKNTDIGSKTGTSTYDKNALKIYGLPESASMDNWGITYSPDTVISIWYGVKKDLTPNKDRVTDPIRAHNERKILTGVLSTLIFKEGSRFNRPSGIISSEYEEESNPAELPSDYTPNDLIATELFKKGTEPSEISDRFSLLENPTNGNASISSNLITLSWNAISTPNAINTSYLENSFQEKYGQFAENYLNKRIEYNNANIGQIGYQVYLSTPSGLQPLGYTLDTTYSYPIVAPGSYTFVVKSAYSIFKSNMSTGITITINTDNVSSSPTPNPNPTPSGGNESLD